MHCVSWPLLAGCPNGQCHRLGSIREGHGSSRRYENECTHQRVGLCFLCYRPLKANPKCTNTTSEGSCDTEFGNKGNSITVVSFFCILTISTMRLVSRFTLFRNPECYFQDQGTQQKELEATIQALILQPSFKQSRKSHGLGFRVSHLLPQRQNWPASLFHREPAQWCSCSSLRFSSARFPNRPLLFGFNNGLRNLVWLLLKQPYTLNPKTLKL